MSREDKAWLDGYRMGARFVSDLRAQGWAKGKGALKHQLRAAESWALDRPALAGGIDALLDAVN